MATTNPYDIKPPVVTTDMVTNSAAGSTVPEVAINPYTSSGVFNPATTSTYNAASTFANGYDPAKWNVDANQTVQGQVNNIIAADSPLMQQAKTGALQTMNQRGLINSSMAIGAGQDAVIKNALPMATSDATTYANSNQANTKASNDAGQFNATATNLASAQNQLATNTAAQYNAGALTDTAKYNATSALTNSQFNAGQQNTVREANAQRQQTANITKADAQNKLIAQQLDSTFKAALANADSQTKIKLQEIDADTRLSLADTESTFKQLMQTTASASDLYQQTIKNINDLVMNPDLDADAISAATTNQLNNLKSGMAVLDALNNSISGLKELITITPPA